MTNVNCSAVSKHWHSVFPPSRGYSATIQNYVVQASHIKNILMFRKRKNYIRYLKSKNIRKRLYFYTFFNTKHTHTKNYKSHSTVLKSLFLGHNTRLTCNILFLQNFQFEKTRFNRELLYLNKLKLKYSYSVVMYRHLNNFNLFVANLMYKLI